MVSIHERLKSEGFSSRMILQIHDELVFEVRDDELEAISPLVTEEMEGVIKLKVPVKVNLKVGDDWRKVD